MTATRLKINGCNAEVLRESRCGYFRAANGAAVSLEVPARITPSWIKQVIAQAEAAGAEEFHVEHWRYICYRLRTTLRDRSGDYLVKTTYRKSNDWKSARVVENRSY